MELKYFRLHEFDSPDKPGSGEMMDEEFLLMLDVARDIAGFPFKINSGFRTVQHNREIGGSKQSSHMLGYAADIRCTDSRRRFILLEALLEAGFHRIGVYDSFLHCDNDPNKPAHVIWTL